MRIKSCLETFQERLAELRDYIEGINLATKLSAPEEDMPPELSSWKPLLEYRDHTLRQRRNQRRFEYNSVIVSLYGGFEQFVETLIEFYISDLNMIVPKYEKLPESITKNHYRVIHGTA